MSYDESEKKSMSENLMEQGLRSNQFRFSSSRPGTAHHHFHEKWKSTDFSDKWFRFLKRLTLVAFHLVQGVLQRNLFEVFFLTIIVSGVYLRNVVGFVFMSVGSVGLTRSTSSSATASCDPGIGRSSSSSVCSS